jgi:dipeptidyl-peptidase-4
VDGSIPIAHSAALAAPLIIIHGTSDPAVPYADTLTLARHMIAQDKPFELVTLPGSTHSWDNFTPEQTRFTYAKIIDFFDRNLRRPARRGNP